MDYEKTGLFALGLAAVVFIAPRALSFALGSAAKMVVPGSKIVGEGRQGRQPGDLIALQAASAPVEAAAPGAGFARGAVEAVGGDWEAAADCNTVLARLQGRRQASVAREGGPLRNKVAWKIAVCSQAALYRVVMLAEGSAQMWNGRNPLGAALCARNILVCAAALVEFERELRRLCDAGDLAAIDAFVMARTFSNGLDGVGDTAPAVAAADVTRLVDASEGVIRGARARYDRLSALCDAASLGQMRFFGTLDKASTEVSFAAAESFDKAMFEPVLDGVRVIGTLEGVFAGIESLLPRVAEL